MTAAEWLTDTDPTRMLCHVENARKRWLFGMACTDRAVHLLPDEPFQCAHALLWRVSEKLDAGGEFDINECRNAWPVHDHPITRARLWTRADAATPEHALAVAREAAAYAVHAFGCDFRIPFWTGARTRQPPREIIAAEEVAVALAAEALATGDPELVIAQAAENVAIAFGPLGLGPVREFFAGQDFALALSRLRTVPTERQASAVAVAAAYTRARVWHAELLRDIFGNPFRPVAVDPSWRTSTAVTLARTMYESRDFGAMPILADALQDAGCASEDILNHCRDTALTHVKGCWVVDMLLGKE